MQEKYEQIRAECIQRQQLFKKTGSSEVACLPLTRQTDEALQRPRWFIQPREIDLEPKRLEAPKRGNVASIKVFR
jgi:hypothetical protein